MRVEPVHQRDMMSDRRLALTVSGDDARSVRLEAALVGDGGTEGLPLTVPATARLEPRRRERVVLRVRREAVTAVGVCAPRKVVVEARPAGDAQADALARAEAPLEPTPPRCGRFFGPDSVWNRPLPDDAPVDPASPALVGELRRQVEHNYRARFGPEINAHRFGVPIYTVPESQPRSGVALDRTGGFTQELRRAFSSVPIPSEARPAAGSDRHLVVWQPSTDTLWEFWGLERRDDGWHAGWGGRMQEVSRNPGYFRPARGGVEWGATGTGLPLVGGLITVAELQRGSIQHALALALPEARAGVWAAPARRTDGKLDSRHAIPEGARFRLDPAVDLDPLELPPVTRMLAEAAQRYGMIIRDQAGVVAFFGEDPAAARADPYRELFGGTSAAEALRAFPWNRLQLVKMQLRSS